MSKNKKSTILLAVLLLMLGVVALMDKEISVLEYVCLYINAVLYLGLVYHKDSLNEHLVEFIDMQDNIICAQQRKIKRYFSRICELQKEIKHGKHDSTAAD